MNICGNPDCEAQNLDNAKLCAMCGQALSGGAGPGSGQAMTQAEGMGGVLPTRLEGGAAVPDTSHVGGGVGMGASGAAAGATQFSEAASKPLAGWLVVMRSRSLPAYHEIPIYVGQNTMGQAATLGRHYVADPNVSKQHCVVVGKPGGEAMITDLGSSNGTFVNRQKVENTVLNRGDELKLGKTTFVFVPFTG